MPVLLLQAVGSASTAVCTILLARTLGPAAQGAFSSFKADFDLLAGAGMLGLPQAIIYYLGKQKLSRRRVLRLSLWQTSLVGVVVTGLFLAVPLEPVVQQAGFDVVLLAAAAVAALVVHGNARALVLVDGSASLFAFVTVLPSLAVVATLAGAIWTLQPHWSASVSLQISTFTIAYVPAAALAWMFASARPAAERVQSEEPIKSLLIYGSTTFILATLQSAAQVGALQWIRRGLGDQAGVGIFAAGTMIASTALLPVNYLGPLVFKSWIAGSGALRWSQLHRWIGALGALTAAMLVAFALGYRPIVNAVFGEQYTSHGAVLPLLLATAFPMGSRNLLHIYVFAGGRPWLAMPGELTRQVALVIGAASSTQVLQVAVTWVIAESLGAIVTWFMALSLHRRQR